MNIAYINCDGGVPPIGHKGCSIHVHEMINAFIALDHGVDLYSVRCEMTDPRLNAVHPVFKRKMPYDNEKYYCLKLNKILWNCLQRNHASRLDLFYERYSLWSAAAMEYAQRYNIPSILEVNSPLVEEQQRHRGLKEKQLAREMAIRNFTCADRIVAVSKAVARYIESQVPAAKKKIRIIPNGINPENFPATKEHALHPDPLVVGFLGTLKQWHGLDSLVHAVHRLHRANRPVKLLVIGDGPERRALHNRIQALGLANAAEITGPLSHAQAVRRLLEIDIAVAPYPEIENFYFSPMKLFEYMACGLAVIASDVGDIGTVIEHEHTGLLYTAGDSEGLLNNLLRLAENPALRMRMGRRARSKVMEHHTWQINAQKLLNDPLFLNERRFNAVVN